MVVFAIIGIVAVFAIGYWVISTKFPSVGNKVTNFVDKVFGAFRRKDSQTVEKLDKLDKE